LDGASEQSRARAGHCRPGHHARAETNVNMSIDQQEQFRTSQSEAEQQQQADSEKSERPRRFELSVSQIVGGALAAMTAAAIGSRLGAAGTIIGAAAASVVAAVSGAIYTASVRHTHEKVKTIWPDRWRVGNVATVQLVTDRTEPNAAMAPAQQLAPRERPGGSRLPFYRLPWRTALIGALLAFGIAAVAVTGLELISGRALSGDDGTTISQVSRQDSADDRQSNEKPKAKESDPTATQGSTEDTQPTQTPEADRSSRSETTAQQDAPSAAPTSSANAPTSTPPPSAPTGNATGSGAAGR
jgi:hypothetical protein